MAVKRISINWVAKLNDSKVLKIRDGKYTANYLPHLHQRPMAHDGCR